MPTLHRNDARVSKARPRTETHDIGPNHVTFTDISLDSCIRTERVERLRQAYFRACPEICIERPDLITRYHRELGLFDKPSISILDKALVYRRVLEERDPVVWHESALDRDGEHFELDSVSLFAGSTTSKFKGVVLYPELIALFLWPELHTISTRKANPLKLTVDDADRLNRTIFPAWLDRTLLERARADAALAVERGERPSMPDFALFQNLVFFLSSKAAVISHTIPDLSRAVHEGLRAVIEDAEQRRASTGDAETREFYQAIIEVLEGMIGYSHRLADTAEVMAARERDPVRRRELTTLADIHRHVPEYPARTFREGLTTIWLCWIALHLENFNAAMSFGRLDQLLYDLYRHDIDAGEISIDDAVELCCCLWLKIGDHVLQMPETGEQLFGGTGCNQPITIGGVDEHGQDAVNDLSYVILRAIELMQLRDPNLNARYMPGVNPPQYLRRLCLANVRTGATPALHNDRAVIASLMDKGDTEWQARDYGIVGCVEPASAGRHFGASASILLNLTAALELTLFNGRHRHTGLERLISIETGKAEDFHSFDEFRTAFRRQLEWLAEQAVDLNNLLGRAHQAYLPTPILSALFEGPMENGKGVLEGGATINSSGVAVIGLADTADSLSAVQKVVFEEGALTLPELLDCLVSNFSGQDALQARLANPEKTPKWGNEDSLADGNAAWLIELLDQVFDSHENYRGGRYRVGYWTMTTHAGYGRLTGALPNGRRARENFSSGFTPVSGATPYLTATLASVGAMPARCLSGGLAFNIKLTPDLADNQELMLDRFAAQVEGFFHADEETGDTGGMEIQFNITDRDTFIDAVAHPEKYPKLLVRVSGYTAYFKDLNPEMQKEIIDRTEYVLATGAATRPEPFRLERRGAES